jgi:hypothetical protein
MARPTGDKFLGCRRIHHTPITGMMLAAAQETTLG